MWSQSLARLLGEGSPCRDITNSFSSGHADDCGALIPGNNLAARAWGHQPAPSFFPQGCYGYPGSFRYAWPYLPTCLVSNFVSASSSATVAVSPGLTSISTRWGSLRRLHANKEWRPEGTTRRENLPSGPQTVNAC